MGLVAEKLLGEPNRQLSNGHELRYGTHGSLSVDLDKGTWKDFETDEGGGVLDLVQRLRKCDRRQARDWLEENISLKTDPRSAKPNGDARQAKGRAETKAGGRFVTAYVYTDAEGRLVHRTLRWDPKRFSQQRFEAGEWVGGKGALDGVQRVLYRLPDVLAAEEVVIVEGEKDADRLRSLGFTATTNPEGAKKWQASFAEVLARKHVVMMPDNDAAGRAHVERIAASLHGKAASVKVLHLEGLPPKGDVSNWLDAGHAVNELRKLIAGAPEWKPPTEGDAAWRAKLLEGDQGPLACEANVETALRYAPELAGRIRLNELSHAVECTGLPWRSCEGWWPWTDNDDTGLAIWCQRCGMKVKPATCAAAVQHVAADRPYHPIRAYIDGLRWDGTPRLDSWLETYLGASATGENDEDRAKSLAYLRQIGRKALIQAVARVMEPGCKADQVLILEGPQGAGKSSAVAGLSPDPAWFCDEIADLGSKDAAQDLAGKWIVEMPELSAIKRSEVERNKAFMSRRVDHYRPSYGRRSQDFPRQCVFFGTTNADAYLSDETGNRRFWGVKVGKIALEKLQRERDQLWAEALAAYKAGEKWWLDADTEKVAAEAQAERRITDVWEETLLEWAGRQLTPFTIAEALAGAVRVPIEKQDRSAQMRVAAMLKANGWKRKRLYPPAPARPIWAYVRDEPPVGSGPEAPDGDEVGIQESEVGVRSEVGMVGMQKAQQPQGTAQPSQPVSHTCKVGDKEQDRDTYSPRVRGLENRLGGRDGWDAARSTSHSDPNACIHCGGHCSPGDTENSIRGEDGRWHHLDCELARP
jgi:predicted P-loop ATPase